METENDGGWTTVHALAPEYQQRRRRRGKAGCQHVRMLSEDEKDRIEDLKDLEESLQRGSGRFSIHHCYWHGPYPQLGHFQKGMKICTDYCTRWRLCQAIRAANELGETAVLLDRDDGHAIYYRPGMDDWERVPDGLLLVWDEREVGAEGAGSLASKP